jgi:hypothetical protein
MKIKESSRAAQFYQTAGEAMAKVHPQGEQWRGTVSVSPAD